jgi:hypothetical protein
MTLDYRTPASERMPPPPPAIPFVAGCLIGFMLFGCSGIVAILGGEQLRSSVFRWGVMFVAMLMTILLRVVGRWHGVVAGFLLALALSFLTLLSICGPRLF